MRQSLELGDAVEAAGALSDTDEPEDPGVPDGPGEPGEPDVPGESDDEPGDDEPGAEPVSPLEVELFVDAPFVPDRLSLR